MYKRQAADGALADTGGNDNDEGIDDSEADIQIAFDNVQLGGAFVMGELDPSWPLPLLLENDSDPDSDIDTLGCPSCSSQSSDDGSTGSYGFYASMYEDRLKELDESDADKCVGYSRFS